MEQEGLTTAWAVLWQDCVECPLQQVVNSPVHHHRVCLQVGTQHGQSSHPANIYGYLSFPIRLPQETSL